MAEEKKDAKVETETTKTTESTDKGNTVRNAVFVLASLLVIVFLIGLALIINRGLSGEPNNNNTLVNSDTNIPNNSSSSNNNSDNNSNDSDNSTEDNQEQNEDTPTDNSNDSDNQENSEESNNSEDNANDDGSVGEAASTDNSDSGNSSILPSGHTEDGIKRALSNQTEINMAGYWIPTQYVAGDIPTNEGKYTVQYGDTLWFIAAGHYGDPFKWTTIESANFAQIGYLPNGQHALIFPNQVLVIP